MTEYFIFERTSPLTDESTDISFETEERRENCGGKHLNYDF